MVLKFNRYSTHLLLSLVVLTSSFSSEPRIGQAHNRNGHSFRVTTVAASGGGSSARIISNKSRDRQLFRHYLRNMSQKRRNRKTIANRMDDELKTMEAAYFGIDPLQDDERLKCRYSNSAKYKGAIIEPDVSCYAMVASAYAKSGLGKIGSELAEQVFDRCDRYSVTQRPNMILQTAVMNACIHAEDWEKADGWIQNMEKKFKKSRQQMDAPDTFSFTQYIEGLASSRSLSEQEISKRCDETLDKMHRQAESGENPFASPNRFTCIAAMKCRARRKSVNGREIKGMEVVNGVEALLREMETRYEEATGDVKPNLKPDRYCYVPVANAAARCKGGIEAARHVHALLEELQAKRSETGDQEYNPLEGMYTACFTAYARVEPEHVREASQKVRSLLQELESSKGENSPAVHAHTAEYSPSVHAYTAAINGIIADNTADNLEEVEGILRRMQEVDFVAYQCVIKAYIRSGNVAKADALVWELLDHSSQQNVTAMPPDALTVAACVNAWVCGRVEDTGEALERAGKLLELIVQAYKTNKVLQQQRQVDAWVFENVIRRWSVSRRRDAGEQTEKLIETMLDLSRTVSDRFEPSREIYILTLDAWTTSRREDAGSRAIKMLERMQQLAEDGKIEALNNRALSSALGSITKSANPYLGVKISQKIFQRIVERYIEGDRSTTINARTCASVFACLARTNSKDATVKATELLNQIQELREKGFTNFELSTIGSNCALNLFAKQGLPEHAEGLLTKMKEQVALGEKNGPDIFSYNCVLLAAARSSNRDSLDEAKKSFQTALRAFREIHDEDSQSVTPNPSTYVHFLKACNVLLPPSVEREQLMSKALLLCRQKGLVSKEVWADAKRTIPGILKAQLENEGIDFDDSSSIPPDDWRRMYQGNFEVPLLFRSV